MTWQLRQSMPRDFDCVFQDADPVSNRLLNDYEEQQFLNANQEQVVRLAKTEEFGDLYSSVQFDNHVVTLPKPFLFSVRPGQNHAAKKLNPEPARLVCLYDNAGESFEAGKDSLENPVTRHLGHAQTLIFCYDPTQDPRVRAACTDQSSDPQVTEGTVTSRQENVLHEIAARLRKLSSLPEGSQAKISVIVACTKYDAWSQLLGPTRLAAPFRRIPDRHSQALDLPRVHEVSAQLRELLAKFTPELVQSAESLSVDVLYVPVSATGASPRKDPESGVFGVRPKDIDPMWCDVPLLTSLAKHGGGLVPFLKAKKK